MPTLRVCSLYPELMNIYADRGNIAVLRARCEWRGLGFEHAAASLGEPLDPDAHDLFYIGGGQDRDQVAVAHDMAADQARGAARRGRPRRGGAGRLRRLPAARATPTSSAASELPGVGLVDLRTVREPGPRLIGNCAIEADLGTGPRVIAGFENHGGRTYLGAGEQPLGRVLAGHGNNGRDGFEGVHARQRDRHLPARPAAAQERLARRPPDRAGAGHRARAARRRRARGAARTRSARRAAGV